LTKRRIIFIPGKNPKPEPTQHSQLLQRCLLHGLAHLDQHVANAIIEQNAFDLCAWNYDFYHKHDDISSQLIWIDRLLEKVEADTHDRTAAGLLRKHIMRLVYQLGDALPWLIQWLADDRIKDMLDGSSQYFENHQQLADAARDTVKNIILQSAKRDEKLLIIAHSLGSVIAYDALYELSLSHPNIKHADLLLSIGSPLGLKYTQKRLLSFAPNRASSFPNNICHWKNISACGDLVSIDKTVADDFSAMLKYGLIDSIEDYTDNVVNWYKNDDGYNQHRSYGYLVNPQLSNIIINWWRSYDKT